MADGTSIEWTDASWTPIRARLLEIENDGSGKERIGWHCEHVSEGCRNCYAERINRRLGTGLDFKPGHLFREELVGYHNGEARLFLDEKLLSQPLRWKRPRMVFVCSMTDLFADFVPDEWIDKVFAVMALSPRHIFQVLTKRAKRMREYCSNPETPFRVARAMDAVESPIEWPLPNVWLGISAEDQANADERVPELIATPAAIRFVSAEPLLSAIDFERWLRPRSRPNADGYGGHHGPGWTTDYRRLDWIIAGGESGPNARAMHPDWARSIRDQCAAAQVAFFFKQWGGPRPKSGGRLLDRREHSVFPEIREVPFS
jgi:protein gp37